MIYFTNDQKVRNNIINRTDGDGGGRENHHRNRESEIELDKAHEVTPVRFESVMEG